MEDNLKDKKDDLFNDINAILKKHGLEGMKIETFKLKPNIQEASYRCCRTLKNGKVICWNQDIPCSS